MGLIIALLVIFCLVTFVRWLWIYCNQFVVRSEPMRGRYTYEPSAGIHVYLNRRVNDSPGITVGKVSFNEEDAEKKINDLKVEARRKARILNGKKVK